ncbi:hypothetical protein A0J61_07043 [Choanephora cucurbitarum]|uniref:Uncharacterized protein n=1 Tax=Choanephora cucurbitarum TaxID=101091 RepID=A0A1C7N788_9FUNG|nr:hypothetical protein A0J61_07043 [Choanephora cucurbitarum]
MAHYTSSKREEMAKLYTPDKCKLYELVQYQCEASQHHIECTPFVRLFLRCAGMPTVEVTPEIDQPKNPTSTK